MESNQDRLSQIFDLILLNFSETNFLVQTCLALTYDEPEMKNEIVEMLISSRLRTKLKSVLEIIIFKAYDITF